MMGVPPPRPRFLYQVASFQCLQEHAIISGHPPCDDLAGTGSCQPPDRAQQEQGLRLRLQGQSATQGRVGEIKLGPSVVDFVNRFSREAAFRVLKPSHL